ncbi:chromatin-binding protein RAD9 [Saccharomyces paradoxus]|uniref:Chromatin-binding protein RAD9 n=1 Tax=Saccharomyces paradoxus TaxID=27291 RepID=A0A8B8UNT9_SACPA|nr:Rad9 [Saccharomyces paradoxus]QHS72418.1 Rad9 [Saccharomyces paradoxus]
MSGQLVQWKSSPDRVIQSVSTGAPHSPSTDSDMNETNVPVDALENKANVTNIVDGSPKSNPNPVKFMNTSDIFQKSLGLLDESPQHDDELSIEVGDNGRPNTNISHNERTPDLDRIANFFKSNRTPGKENLLTKYQSSDLEDTPLMSRKKLNLHTTTNSSEQQTFKKLKSNTEFYFYREQNDGENNTSLEVTEADATFVQMAEHSVDNYDGALEGVVTPKRYKDDLIQSGGARDRGVQKTEITTSTGSPNSISSYDKNVITENDWTIRNVNKVFGNNEDDTKATEEENAMKKKGEDCSKDNIRVRNNQIIQSNESEEINEIDKNLNFSSRENDVNNSYIDFEKSAASGTPSRNNEEEEMPSIESASNGAPSKRWVFRYSKDKTENNSNRSTQVVNNPRTQEMPPDSVSIDTQPLSKSYNTEANNELETQIIVSSLSQGISAQRGPEFQSTSQTEEIKTQIINSPEQNALNATLETPVNLSRINFEPILEVPETSSPSKNTMSKPSNSSPIPKEKDAFNVHEKEEEINNVFSNDIQHSSNAGIEDDIIIAGSSDFNGQKEITDKIYLQLSGKQRSDLGSDETERMSQNELDTKKESTIMSEIELTQELPEVEEQQDFDASPKEVINEEVTLIETRKSKAESLQIHPDNAEYNSDEPGGTESSDVVSTKQEGKGKNSELQKNLMQLFPSESQEIIRNRRTIKRRQKDTIEIGEDEENRSAKASPTKRFKRSSNFDTAPIKREASCSISIQTGDTGSDKGSKEQSYVFPESIKTEDNSFLSKENIIFGNAVWCQYSWNYKFYPGILLEVDTNQDGCWIYFETGRSLTKGEDIYYLDIRVGDAVTSDGNEYVVVGLECRSHDPNTIRCIRGYDTVHLKKKNSSGSLGKRTIIKALSSISLDLSEWAKRAKIILEDNEKTKGDAYRYLRHPIRGRKSMTNVLSPKKLTDDEKGMNAHTSVHNNELESSSEKKEIIKKDTKDSLSEYVGVPGLLFSSGEIRKGNVFDKCIFVLTSLFENRDELRQIIESQGGTVIESGFSTLFNFTHPPAKPLINKGNLENIRESIMKLIWKPHSLFTDYRFACLITKRHLRSLKYLETLALGWPTLHWKFISACIEKKRIMPYLIYQYLLPSGESFRLSSDYQSKGGIIKSNNIFSFYTEFLRGSNLRDQICGVRKLLHDYIVIIWGRSELDSFVKFAFACLSAGRMLTIDLPNIDVDNTEPLLNTLGSLVPRIGSALSDQKLKFLIYVNENNGKSQMRLLEKLRSQVTVKFKNLDYKFHTESKEWLIQTIINEDTGFHDDVTDNDI